MKRSLLSLSMGATTTPRATINWPVPKVQVYQGRAVKVRFRSAANAEDVFDFTQFVTPKVEHFPGFSGRHVAAAVDVWTRNLK